MFYHNIDPVLLSLGPLEIRYYGLIYALGFIVSYFFIKKFAKKKEINLTDKDIDSLVFYLAIGVIIGARLFEILFYNLDFYLKNPLEMIALWHGGLSFHGGLLGAIIVAYLFCKKKKIKFLQLADLVSIPVALALFFGRIANFINGELYGRITDLPWAVKFQNAEGFRHPTQVYEALKNLLIFFVLFNFRKYKRKDGYLFGMFLIMYSIIRFFIEFLKEPETYIGPLTTGQFLNIPMFILGLYLILRKNEDK